MGGGAPTLQTTLAVSYASTTNNTFTVAQTLTGPGGLTKLGPGTLVLTGPNSYTGGTTVSAGALSIAADGALGAASGALSPGITRWIAPI